MGSEEDLDERAEDDSHGLAARSMVPFLRAGHGWDAAEAILRADGVMERIRRQMAKRQLLTDILTSMDSELDVPRLDVLGAVTQWATSTEAEPGEVIIGTVASRLDVDPSRASRLVAELVALGYLRRAASQTDSRRTVIEATDRGWALLEEVRQRKGEVLARGLDDWSEQDLTTFARLIDRWEGWTARGLEVIKQDPSVARSA